MTRLDPSIRISRMKLFSEGKVAYDEKFNLGVNIIRSETNSCGKSTIMEFLFYLLGGEVTEWTNAAKQIDFGLLEVLFNGKTYTLKRELQGGIPPSYVYEGDLESSEKKQTEWVRFGQKRTESIKSFSQVVFEALGFPEQKAGGEANVTFNQVLRLVYCDQKTSVNKIYKDAGPFDKEIMRRSIIELLLGVDDFKLHDLRLSQIQKQRELSGVSGEVKSLSDTLREIHSVEEFRADFVDSKIDELEREIQTTQVEVENISTGKSKTDKASEKPEIKRLEKKIISSRSELASNRSDLAKLVFEIEDSQRFVDSLTERRNSLGTAIAIKEIIGTLSFQFCPVCLTEVAEGPDATHCGLCKSEIKPSTKHFNRIKAKNEIDFQIRESQELLKLRFERRQILAGDISDREKELKRSIREFDAHKQLPNYLDSEIRTKLGRIGYLEKSIEGLVEKKKLGSLLEAKLAEKQKLSGEVSNLGGKIRILEKDRASKLSRRHLLLGKKIKEIVKSRGDVEVEDEFKNPREIDIQFEKDKIFLNGNSKFSASSEVILKNSLFLALFYVSCSEPEMRFPRLLLLDNIEDKGMTPDRSASFQKQIVEMSEELAESEHQVVFTTSMILKELDKPLFCVGPKYSPSQRTLSVRTV